MKRIRLLAGILVALMIALVLSHLWQERHLRRDLAGALLRADSLEAAADTTRRVLTEALDHSTIAFERRLVQERQHQDSLDRVYRRERTARIAAEIQVRALDTTLTGQVTTDSLDLVRRAHWGPVYQEPYTVEVEVALPRPPAEASLQLGIKLDPIPVELRPGCGPAGPTGIRPATVAATVPEWAPITFTLASQDPAVCRSPALQPRKKPLWERLTVYLGVFAAGMLTWEVAR